MNDLRTLLNASAEAGQLAIVAAHPDDEVIGLGARLPALHGAQFLHVTDGAAADGFDSAAHGFRSVREYARARRRELEAALTLAGVDRFKLHEFGVPDKEAGLNLVAISLEMAKFFAANHVTLVITHSYEGGHPDHDSTAFAVHAASRILNAATGHGPNILEMTSYHLGPWGMEVGSFLHPWRSEVTTFVLNPIEREFKQALFDCFETQHATLAQFAPSVERFRPAPRYNFSQPPHLGKLFYEHYDWGMTAPSFLSFATEALGRLGLENTI